MTDNFGFSDATAASDGFKAIVAWLLKLLPGLAATTAWEDYTSESSAPNVKGGVWNTTFDDGKGTDKSKELMESFLIQRSPEVALVLMAERYNVTSVDKINPPRYIPMINQGNGGQTPPTPLPAQPSNPIGQAIAFQNGKFFAAVGDTSPVGSVYRDTFGNNYVKRGYMDPFGAHLWWELQ